MATDESLVAAMLGLSAAASHDQVLRNQQVGSTCSVSAAGPALVTLMAISRSSGPPLA
jgi:hypothetical protein